MITFLETFKGHSLSGFALFRVREGESEPEQIGVFFTGTLTVIARMLQTESNNLGRNDKYYHIPVYSGVWEYDDSHKQTLVNGKWFSNNPKGWDKVEAD